jgi:Domain of unknown function (DUF6597)
MAIRFFQPAEDLRDVIARIYVHDSDACDLAERRWLIVPDGDIKLIFPFSGDIRCTIGDAGRLHGTSRMIVSGMRTLPGYLEFSASLGAVGVIVRPEAAYRLLGVPQHEIANRTLDADEVLGRAMRPWQDRLMDGSKAQERVDRMQAALRDWLKGRDRRDQVLEYAVRRLRRHEGRVRIEELARETVSTAARTQVLEPRWRGSEEHGEHLPISRRLQAAQASGWQATRRSHPRALLRSVPLSQGLQAVHRINATNL